MEVWQQELEAFFDKRTETVRVRDEVGIRQGPTVVDFCSSVLQPAFEELKVAMERHGRRADIELGESSGSLTIHDGARLEIKYAITVTPMGSVILEYEAADTGKRKGFRKYASSIRENRNDNTETIGKQDLIKSFMQDYKRQAGRVRQP